MFKSLAVCPYCAFESFKYTYEPEGYEVVPDIRCPNTEGYVFDNNGQMSWIKINNGRDEN